MGWLPMTYTVKHARSGLTAIAAVLALSSTPLLAQEVTETPTTTADTTAAPAQETAAPEPTATETTSAQSPTAESTPAESAAPATTTRRTATRTKTTTTATRRATSEPAAAAATPIAATPAPEATAEGMPVPPPTGAMVDPGAMPVDETATETTAKPADDALPIAGAAGLGLLALGGIGMAIGRRRQRKEELAHQRANQEYLKTHPDTPESHAPAMAFASTAAAPAMAGSVGRPIKDAPRTNLPPNFDLSRFGPHTRAAYMGPTEDNPSLSMKHRLRRAAAMDQQLRQHGEAPREAAHAAPVREPVHAASARDTVQASKARSDQAKKPMWNSDNDGFMLRRAGSKSPSKPAYQH